MRAGGCCERGPADTRLHRRGEVVGRHVDDPVHPREVEADAAPDRDHLALEARAGAVRGDGDTQVVGEPEHGGDLGRRGRVDDQVGAARAVEARVDGVQVAVGVAGGDARPVAADRRDERRAQLAHGGASSPSSSVSVGSDAATRSSAQRMLSCTACSAAAPSRASHAASTEW